MPVYEYYCPKCATKFEQLRPMSQSDDPATCPQGHRGSARTLSVFASVTKGAGGGSEPMPSSGGCGGGACDVGGACSL